MPPEHTDALLGGIVIILASASIGTWFYLADRLRHGPILSYEPRRPVPWHGVWTAFPLLLVGLTLVSAIWGDTPVDDRSAAASELVERIALGSAQQLALVVALFVAMVAVSRATRDDLGLPRDRRELVRDIRIGVVAWLAAIGPVYCVQFLLISIFGQAAGHPLIKMVEEHFDPALFLLAFAAAVVVAPFSEELMFRLVLQGWLEKWEDAQLGWRTPLMQEPPATVELAADPPIEMLIPAEQVAPIETLAPESPPEAGVGGMPYGWLPIIASSVLFALAHVGYGPDPIPLFLLALILGYVYQRTHRIVPSMVTHALFNGMSLFALWRAMSAGGP